MKLVLLMIAVVACLDVFIACQTASTRPFKPPAKTKAQIETENKAFAETKAKADQGFAGGQYSLGWMYRLW